MRGALLFAPAAIVIGCGGPTYAEVRETCGLGNGEFVPLPSGEEGTYHPIEAPCSDALVEAFDVEWSSFADEPPGRVVGAESIGDALISGLHVLLFSDQGTLGDVASVADDNEAVMALWHACDPHQRIDSGAPLGEFWFHCGRWSTSRLRAKEPTENEGMSYELGIVNISPDLAPWRTTVGYASRLGHEMTHCCTPDHVDPSEGDDGFDSGAGVDYDPGSSGSYAAGVRILWQWLVRNESQAPMSDVELIRTELAIECAHIEDPGALATACSDE